MKRLSPFFGGGGGRIEGRVGGRGKETRRGGRKRKGEGTRDQESKGEEGGLER